MRLNELKHKAATISDKIFGRENPVTAPIIKLMDETEELIDCLVSNQDPSEEFADCFLLLLDAYRKHFGDDVDMQKLIDDSSKKLDVIVGRKWGEPNEYGVFQHIETIEIPSITLSEDEFISPECSKTEHPIDILQEPVNDVETAKKMVKKPKNFDIKRIQEVYNKIVEDVSFETADDVTRNKIKNMLEDELPYYHITCNEENNPPEVVDNSQIWARVTDTDNGQYVDLIF
jgi:hypothetical protein